jgi:hypothetical protein
LDSNPKRDFCFSTGIFNPEQSVVLVSRPYSLKLELYKDDSSSLADGFAFTDGGTAFVNALEHETSSFGSLKLEFNKDKIPLATDNL